VKAKPKVYVDSVQLIDDSKDDEALEGCVGSLAVRQAAHMQRRFEQQLDDDSEFNTKPVALWLSLDALTGEVILFPRAAALRLEAAHVNNRATVPLAGLGGGLEDGIVFIGCRIRSKQSDVHPVHKVLGGGEMDVRRIEVAPNASEVCINVVRDRIWHIPDVAIPGTTEQRCVHLNGTEIVRPPTPPLPPVNPDRRVAFCNIGADWGGYE